MSNFDKILHGGVDLGFDLQTLERYGKDGEDGDLKQNFSNKTPNIYGKNFPVYNQYCKIDCWFIALKQQKSK